MVKLGSSKYIYAGAGVLFVVIGLLFVVTGRFGNLYKSAQQKEALDTIEKMGQAKYDVRRIKYEGEDGKSIEILQNGTIVSSDDTGKKQAVLGFSRLEELFSRLTEEELRRLQNQGGQGATLTVETKSGAIYVIHVNPNTDPVVDDLIDDIIDTDDDTFNPPTPIPTPFVESTPSPTGGPTPTPTSGPTPPPTGGTPPPNGPTPSPSLPPFVGLEPFDCNDYALTKNATISNIICEPNQ
jgi:cell division septation protein DedD